MRINSSLNRTPFFTLRIIIMSFPINMNEQFIPVNLCQTLELCDLINIIFCVALFHYRRIGWLTYMIPSAFCASIHTYIYLYINIYITICNTNKYFHCNVNLSAFCTLFTLVTAIYFMVIVSIYMYMRQLYRFIQSLNK